MVTTNISKFQSLIKGRNLRKNRLPNSILSIHQILTNTPNIKFCNTSDDGRINSCMDEDEIIQILLNHIDPTRLFIPKVRMWYDILVKDYIYGWLPVNIKSTTTLTSDNTGNLAMCVYAYTNENMDPRRSYQNGQMSTVLVNNLKNKHYNYNDKRDYYFLVVNKNKPRDIIVNSVKGLTELTPNINNLPFQVCWDKNREYKFVPIRTAIGKLLTALKRPRPSWKETFMTDVRNINL